MTLIYPELYPELTARMSKMLLTWLSTPLGLVCLVAYLALLGYWAFKYFKGKKDRE